VDKLTYPQFLRETAKEDRPRTRDLYEQYLMSPFDDVCMFLANFRGEG
jgi:hypothetical protein